MLLRPRGVAVNESLPAYETYDDPEPYEVYDCAGYECPYPFEESYELDFEPGTY